jgi:hypothetical protein
MEIYHIRINGKPYCQVENSMFDGMRYPTNCAHGSLDSAEKGAAQCRAQRPDATVEVVEGCCHTDPFWKTPEGRGILQDEWEMNEARWE